MRRLLLLLTLLLAAAPALRAQTDTLRFCTYNLLNWSESTGGSRVDDFATVLDSIQPDLVAVQEMVTSGGADLFLQEVLGGAPWARSSFTSGVQYDVVLYYRGDRFVLLNRSTVSTDLRTIEIYEVRRIGDPEGPILFVASTHLKASQGTDNEQRRLSEVNDFLAFLDSHGLNDDEVLFCGDFNFYRSSEPGYQALMEDSRFLDPISSPGNWHDNAQFSFLHTQSPRTTSFGGGATGGLDDRFDFVLATPALFDGGGWDYLDGSYTSFGNDGNHLNQAINSGTNSAVSAEVADALHDASDHLPVFIDLLYTATPRLFAKVEPVDGAVVYDLTVPLLWRPAPGDTLPDPFLYEVQWTPDTTFTAPESAVTTDTALVLAGLADLATYRWRVFHAEGGGDTLWADDDDAGWSFSTDAVQAPAPFSLLSPADGDTVWMDEADFRWQASGDLNPFDTVHYDVWLDTLPDLSTATLIADSTADTTLHFGWLADDTEFFWAVRATDSNTPGTWSDTAGFRVFLPQPPDPFALVSPPDSTEFPDSRDFPLEFQWEAASDPDPGDSIRYELQLALDPDFTEGLGFFAGSELHYEVDRLDRANYWWRVVAMDRYGLSTPSLESWRLDVTLFAAESAALPSDYALEAVYPNPFNPTARVRLSLPEAADLRLEVYNLLGQRVAVLLRGRVGAGVHTVTFDASSFASGVYIVRAVIPGRLDARRRVVLLR